MQIKNNHVLENFLLAAIPAAPALFMAVPHAGNTVFFLVFLAALWGLLSPSRQQQLGKANKVDPAIIFALLLPFSAVAIGQILRGSLHLPEFDAPSRLLAAVAIFYFLVRENRFLKVKPSVLLGLGAAVGLALLAASIDPSRTTAVGGRLSTKLSWPNDLGAYAGILLTFVVWLMTLHRPMNKGTLALVWFSSVLSCLAGAYVFIGAQSRGPWIATGITFLMMAAILGLRRWGPRKTLLISLFVAIGIGSMVSLSTLSPRLTSIVAEPLNWMKSRQENSSAGERLSMAVASADLISKRPWSGYGDFGYLKEGCNEEFKKTTHYSRALCDGAGPHNEVLARGLQSGVWGLIATTALLFIPIAWFARHMWVYKTTDEIFNPAFLGLIFSVNIALVCMFMEPYSIKFTVTFNAFVLALLFAEVTASRSSQTSVKGVLNPLGQSKP
jgi:O-antigen ligase